MCDDSLNYTVLLYEDECGLWMKIPEFDVQLLTEDMDMGMEQLEEHLDWVLAGRAGRGEAVPQHLVRTVRRVGKVEYGPTQVELEERRWREEREEEESAEEPF
jgi:hypothetical protein